MEVITKEVDFEKYCKTCKYSNTQEADEPCNDCLAIPARPNSHKPEFWKEK